MSQTVHKNFSKTRCLAGEKSEYVKPKGNYEFFGGECAKEGDAESATTTDCISRNESIPDWQKEIEEEYEYLHWDIR